MRNIKMKPLQSTKTDFDYLNLIDNQFVKQVDLEKSFNSIFSGC